MQKKSTGSGSNFTYEKYTCNDSGDIVRKDELSKGGDTLKTIMFNYDEDKNVIRSAITLEHKDYASLMGQVVFQQSLTNGQTQQQSQPNGHAQQSATAKRLLLSRPAAIASEYYEEDVYPADD